MQAIIKKVVGKEAMLAYPNLNEKLFVRTHTNLFQLRAIIIEHDRSIVMCSKKLKVS